jgi:hypothetical protein
MFYMVVAPLCLRPPRRQPRFCDIMSQNRRDCSVLASTISQVHNCVFAGVRKAAMNTGRGPFSRPAALVCMSRDLIGGVVAWAEAGHGAGQFAEDAVAPASIGAFTKPRVRASPEAGLAAPTASLCVSSRAANRSVTGPLRAKSRNS